MPESTTPGTCSYCGESWPCATYESRNGSPTLRMQHMEATARERYLRTPLLPASWFAQGIPAILLSLALSAPAWAAGDAPKTPAKPRVKPAVTISVKVYTDGRVAPGQVKISTADADSCTAWIGEDTDAAMVKALQVCRAEVKGKASAAR